MFDSPSWFRYARKHAPKITPGMLPMPPRMIMQRMNTEMLKKKSSGNVADLKLAKNAPATPPKNAPVAYDHVFVRMSGTPIAAAAISSSRIAIHARPRRESRRRTEQNTVKRTSSERGPVERLVEVGRLQIEVVGGEAGVLGDEVAEARAVDRRQALRPAREVEAGAEEVVAVIARSAG